MAQTKTASEGSIDRKLINKLTEDQMAKFREHTPTSAEYFTRAKKVMPGGVPSSFQLNDPWPVYIDKGKGANDAIEYMAKFSGATAPEFKAQLGTTSMFYGAAEAAGRAGNDCGRAHGLTLACCAILRRVAMSLAVCALRSSGLMVEAVMPNSAQRSLMAGIARIFISSACRRSTIGLGVLAGAMRS